ncbi:MAG: hypothetical protein F9K29_03285 [Hyphomicrobiaceae bacterium]|nr:MAG: hypothetical protein F9K29_03285 [Hyphomicrobiaceae bacterium]
MAAADDELLALLLPSKGRLLDLLLTLSLVPLKAQKGYRVHFVVCANYNPAQLALLRRLFSARATFIDEGKLEPRGMTGAYNYALEEAIRKGARWVALWADDLLPEKRAWLDQLFPVIADAGFRFGIFSSDEGNHKGHFGWNVFADFPCAHFFVARVEALPGYMLNPGLRAYVSDNEIAISRVKAGVPVDLLPVRVIHQPTFNQTRTANSPAYRSDLEKFYQIHPELRGRLDPIVLHADVADANCRFVVDDGRVLRFGDSTPRLGIEEFKAAAPFAAPRFSLRVVGYIRKAWNEWIASPGRVVRGAVGLVTRLRRGIA